MNLMDDARRLAKNGFTPWEDSCHLTCDLCGADFAEDGARHAPGCPWLSMPKIVAVLEAAERMVAAWQADTGHGPIPGSMGGFYENFEQGRAYHRERHEAEEALVAALKGEETA